MFALKYAMTQLKCCKKDKVGEAIKEVLVIEEVRMFDSVVNINFQIPKRIIIFAKIVTVTCSHI